MHPLVELAKSAVENYIKKEKTISPPNNFPNEFLTKKSGTFVTIKKEKNLRGCIGTYLPTQENIAKEVIKNAIAAATEDYRFGPVQKNELPFLSYTAYILDKPELIKNIKELNPGKYGIIVKSASFPSKSALLLPNLEGINTTEKQIYITCQKGGIDLNKEKIIIYRFEVKKYQ